MMSSVGLDFRCSICREEVVLQRSRRLEGGLVVVVVADQLDRPPPERRQVLFRQAQQPRDHPGGKLERELLDEIGFAGRRELVDQSVADRTDDFGLPARQRLGLERRGHQIAVVTVLLALHREDRSAGEQPDRRVVPARVERPSVAKHRVHRVERQSREHMLGSHRLGKPRIVDDGAPEDAALPSPLGEERVRVTLPLGGAVG